MARHTRLMALLMLLAFVPFIAACGATEEPAEQPAEETPAEQPAEEAPAEEMPAEEMPAEDAPQEPQLVGNINLSGENFEWGATTSDSAEYTWTVRVANDTTAQLDITVRFEFLDDSDGVVKTETATVRLQPAASTTIREGGSMSFDDANRVYSFAVVTENYEIVTG
jgi:hypothetical protein